MPPAARAKFIGYHTTSTTTDNIIIIELVENISPQNRFQFHTAYLRKNNRRRSRRRGCLVVVNRAKMSFQ